MLFLIIFLPIISQVKTSKESELRGLENNNNFITLTFQGKGSIPIINNAYISSITSIKINTNNEIPGTINQVHELTGNTNIISK